MMLNKIKIYIIIVISTIILCFISYKIYAYYKQKENNKQIQVLKEEISNIKNMLVKQNEITERYKNELDVAKNNIIEANKVTKDAIKKLEEIKKPQPEKPIENVDDVKYQISKYYSDNTVEFVDGKFRIIQPTMFKVTEDAVKWKINYPYYEQKISAYQTALDKSQYENSLKDVALEKSEKVIISQDKSLSLCNDLQLKNDKTIKLYEHQLQLSENSGKLNIVFGFAAGAGAYYVIDRLFKR